MSIGKLFGENLARQREAAGLSQEEVGVRAEVHRTEVSSLERGLRCPRIDTVVKLAGTLGVEPSVLLDGIAWTPATLQPGHFEQPDPAGTL